MKNCNKCFQELNNDNWYPYFKKDSYYICKFCYQANARKNHDPAKQSKRMKEYTFNLKVEIMNAYGGKCVCCGEDNPIFLTIDHKLNNGAEERRNISSGGEKFYRYLKKQGYPQENYQILCFNCNMCTGYYGVCFHKLNIINKDICCICCTSINNSYEKNFSMCAKCMMNIKNINNLETKKNYNAT